MPQLEHPSDNAAIPGNRRNGPLEAISTSERRSKMLDQVNTKDKFNKEKEEKRPFLKLPRVAKTAAVSPTSRNNPITRKQFNRPENAGDSLAVPNKQPARLKKDVLNQERKKSISKLPNVARTATHSPLNKNITKLCGQCKLDDSGDSSAGPSKAPISPTKLRKILPSHQADKTKASHIPLRNTTIKKIFGSYQNETKKTEHGDFFKESNVQRLQIPNLGPDFGHEDFIPPTALASTRPIPSIGHIYGRNDNLVDGDWFVELDTPMNSLESTDARTVQMNHSSVSDQSALEIRNCLDKKENPTFVIDANIYKTTNENVSDWLSNELDLPTRDNDQEHREKPANSANDIGDSLSRQSGEYYSLHFRKSSEKIEELSNLNEKHTEVKLTVTEPLMTEHQSVVIANVTQTVSKLKVDQALEPIVVSRVELSKNFQYPSVSDPDSKRGKQVTAPSYVDCPSEILQRTTNFEIDGCESRKTMSSIAATDLDIHEGYSSHYTLEDELSLNEDLINIRWCHQGCTSQSCTTFVKSDESVATTHSLHCVCHGDKEDSLGIFDAVYDHDKPRHCRFSRSMSLHHISISNCKKHSRYSRFPSYRYKLIRPFNSLRKRLSIGRICRRRWDHVWKKTAARWHKRLKSQSKMGKYKIIEYLQGTTLWQDVDVQTLTLVYQETGTHTNVMEKKSTGIGTSMKLSPSCKQAETGVAGTSARSFKSRFKQINMGPSRFPFFYNSTITLPVTTTNTLSSPINIQRMSTVEHDTETEEYIPSTMTYNLPEQLAVPKIERPLIQSEKSIYLPQRTGNSMSRINENSTQRLDTLSQAHGGEDTIRHVQGIELTVTPITGSKNTAVQGREPAQGRDSASRILTAEKNVSYVRGDRDNTISQLRIAGNSLPETQDQGKTMPTMSQTQAENTMPLPLYENVVSELYGAVNTYSEIGAENNVAQVRGQENTTSLINGAEKTIFGNTPLHIRPSPIFMSQTQKANKISDMRTAENIMSQIYGSTVPKIDTEYNTAQMLRVENTSSQTLNTDKTMPQITHGNNTVPQVRRDDNTLLQNRGPRNINSQIQFAGNTLRGGENTVYWGVDGKISQIRGNVNTISQIRGANNTEPHAGGTEYTSHTLSAENVAPNIQGLGMAISHLQGTDNTMFQIQGKERSISQIMIAQNKTSQVHRNYNCNDVPQVRSNQNNIFQLTPADNSMTKTRRTVNVSQDRGSVNVFQPRSADNIPQKEGYKAISRVYIPGSSTTQHSTDTYNYKYTFPTVLTPENTTPRYRYDDSMHRTLRTDTSTITGNSTENLMESNRTDHFAFTAQSIVAPIHTIENSTYVKNPTLPEQKPVNVAPKEASTQILLTFNNIETHMSFVENLNDAVIYYKPVGINTEQFVLDTLGTQPDMKCCMLCTQAPQIKNIESTSSGKKHSKGKSKVNWAKRWYTRSRKIKPSSLSSPMKKPSLISLGKTAEKKLRDIALGTSLPYLTKTGARITSISSAQMQPASILTSKTSIDRDKCLCKVSGQFYTADKGTALHDRGQLCEVSTVCLPYGENDKTSVSAGDSGTARMIDQSIGVSMESFNNATEHCTKSSNCIRQSSSDIKRNRISTEKLINGRCQAQSFTEDFNVRIAPTEEKSTNVLSVVNQKSTYTIISQCKETQSDSPKGVQTEKDHLFTSASTSTSCCFRKKSTGHSTSNFIQTAPVATIDTWVQYSHTDDIDKNSIRSARTVPSKLISSRMLNESMCDTGTQAQPICFERETKPELDRPSYYKSMSVMTSADLNQANTIKPDKRFSLLCEFARINIETNTDSKTKVNMHSTGCSTQSFQPTNVKEVVRATTNEDVSVNTDLNIGKAEQSTVLSRLIGQAKSSVRPESGQDLSNGIFASDLNAAKWIKRCTAADKDYQAIIDIGESNLNVLKEASITIGKSTKSKSQSITKREFRPRSNILCNMKTVTSLPAPTPSNIPSDDSLADVIPVKIIQSSLKLISNKDMRGMIDKNTSDKIVSKEFRESVLQACPEVRDTATDALTDSNEYHRSVCAFTSRCVLPAPSPCNVYCNYSTDCVFVYDKPRCAVHKNRVDAFAQYCAVQNEDPTQEPAVNQDINFHPIHRIGEVLSPKVYKALYERTKLFAKNKPAHPARETGMKCISNIDNKTELIKTLSMKSAAILTSSNCFCSKPNPSPASHRAEYVFRYDTPHPSIVGSSQTLSNYHARLLEIPPNCCATDFVEERVKTQLVGSCRYYSKLLTKRLGVVKEKVTKHLAPPNDQCMYYTSLPKPQITEACTMKPSGHEELGVQTFKHHKLRNENENQGCKTMPCCTISPSLTNICENADKNHLKSVYYMLTSIEGRIRRLNRNF